MRVPTHGYYARKQPARLTPQDVAPSAYKWSRDELEEMKAIIARPIEATELKQEPIQTIVLSLCSSLHIEIIINSE